MISPTLILIFFFYILSILAMGYIAYIAADPYGHEPVWKRWAEILMIAFLWPVLIVLIGLECCWDILTGKGK